MKVFNNTAIKHNLSGNRFGWLHYLTLFGILCGALFLYAQTTFAQSITLDLGSPEGGVEGDVGGQETLSGRVVQLLGLLTILSLAPSILIMMTSFTRIVIVLSFLRTAMGVQQTPPNTVMISLALFLTFFIMAPTFNAAYETALQPLLNQEIEEAEALERGIEPFKAFMLSHTRPKDLQLFQEISEAPEVEAPMDLSMTVVIPSFMISELRRAFEIGFMLFLPFLIIDMVTASILMSMGMMMLPPVMISLPFKIIFFVMVDGWYMVAGSLIKSFDQSLPLPDTQ